MAASSSGKADPTKLLAHQCEDQKRQQLPTHVHPAVSVRELAAVLHGTWVRRLTIGGTQIETNSIWYFDLASLHTGQGSAMMIDRLSQGWDDFGSIAPVSLADPQERLGPPATTGGFWRINLRQTVIGSPQSRRPGIAVTLAGQYRGTGDDYPAGGFEFTESGVLVRTAQGYQTLQPWRAPPQADASGKIQSSGAAYTPVDALLIAFGAGGSLPSMTFVLCSEGVVDRYYKVSNFGKPPGSASLAASWAAALQAGLFDRNGSNAGGPAPRQ
jgi:hypothetical protein